MKMFALGLMTLAMAAPVMAKDCCKDSGKSATTQAAVKDAGNTKCMIMPSDDVTAGVVSVYEGVTYHFCCKDCIPDFKKDPAKYVKALQENPKKYGVK